MMVEPEEYFNPSGNHSELEEPAHLATIKSVQSYNLRRR